MGSNAGGFVSGGEGTLPSVVRWLLPEEEAKRELRPWSRRQVAIGAALWIVGAAALTVLSVFAHQYAEFPDDLRIEEGVQQLYQLHQAWLTAFVNFTSDANWPMPAGITAIVIILLLAIFHHVRAAIGAIVAGFGADFVNVLLNGFVARPRPNNVHIHAVAHLGLHSYPSGHVTHVIGFYGFLLYLTVVELRVHPRWRPWLAVVQAICLYFIILIGPSRVLEGEHWPSDVVASYLLGGLVLALAIALHHALTVWYVRYCQRRAQRAA